MASTFPSRRAISAPSSATRAAAAALAPASVRPSESRRLCFSFRRSAASAFSAGVRSGWGAAPSACDVGKEHDAVEGGES